MVARKSVKKVAAPKKAPVRKAAARTKPAAASGAKKTASKKVAKTARVEKPPTRKPTTPRGKFSAQAVNLGHVFALRPRVTTSFPQANLRTARLLLQDQAYASMEEAARAVADKALELTREKRSKRVFGHGS